MILQDNCLNFNRTYFWYSSSFDVTWPSNLFHLCKPILPLTKSRLAVPYRAYLGYYYYCCCCCWLCCVCDCTPTQSGGAGSRRCKWTVRFTYVPTPTDTQGGTVSASSSLSTPRHVTDYGQRSNVLRSPCAFHIHLQVLHLFLVWRFLQQQTV